MIRLQHHKLKLISRIGRLAAMPPNQIVGSAFVPAKTLAITASSSIDPRLKLPECSTVRAIVDFSAKLVHKRSSFLIPRTWPHLTMKSPLRSMLNLKGRLSLDNSSVGVAGLANYVATPAFSRFLSTSAASRQKLSEAVSSEVLSGPGAPTTRVTQLANGFRIATETSPGHFHAVGVYIDAGTRFESEKTAGVSHILDRIAFKVRLALSGFFLN